MRILLYCYYFIELIQEKGNSYLDRSANGLGLVSSVVVFLSVASLWQIGLFFDVDIWLRTNWPKVEYGRSLGNPFLIAIIFVSIIVWPLLKWYFGAEKTQRKMEQYFKHNKLSVELHGKISCGVLLLLACSSFLLFSSFLRQEQLYFVFLIFGFEIWLRYEFRD